MAAIERGPLRFGREKSLRRRGGGCASSYASPLNHRRARTRPSAAIIGMGVRMITVSMIGMGVRMIAVVTIDARPRGDIAHGMTMPIRSARPSRPAPHCSRGDAR